MVLEAFLSSPSVSTRVEINFSLNLMVDSERDVKTLHFFFIGKNTDQILTRISLLTTSLVTI